MQGTIEGILKSLNINGTISVKTQTSEDGSPPSSPGLIFGQHQSQPLDRILKKALKKSIALVFDALFLTLIVRDNPETKRWAHGLNVIARILSIDTHNAQLVDGSGLSIYNYITPKLLAQVLRRGAKNPAYRNLFAHPGEPRTTLGGRVDLPKSVRAKTGSLTGSRCLCGFLGPDVDAPIFAMIHTGYTPGKGIEKIFADQAQLLHQWAQSS